ncbi:MAG: hypothetical protein AB7U24_06820 [Sulfurimonadaceae bacterium]|jgi:uncharacterized integral membrane protein
MGEPTLQDIEDYDTLKGEKKKVVWTVIIAGLLLGVIYVVAYNYFDNAEENIKVQERVKSVPLR